MGTPIIDHYGDLVVSEWQSILLCCVANIIANHRTGETCTLTFKPRGWRGNNAFEIKGNVIDAAGNTAWDIAGRELSPFKSTSELTIRMGYPAYRSKGQFFRTARCRYRVQAFAEGILAAMEEQ